jgi:hypothetical protein
MGWMCSWVAIQGADKSAVFEHLGVAETAELVDPGSRVAPFSCAERGGWLIVFSEKFDWGDRKRTAELSRFGLAVGCQFEDKVEMTSVACAARGGVELWCVSHINDPIYRLDVSGEPPAELAAIRERLIAEQDAEGGEESSVDFIHEIPLEVAKAACGYRADEVEDAFRALEPTRRAAPRSSGGLLGRLFGRR